MLLSVSGKIFHQTDVDLSVLNPDGASATEDGGVPNGKVLLDLTEAVLQRDAAALEGARKAVADALGPEAVVDTGAIIASFTGNVRVADGTGIPLDEGTEAPRRQVAEALGMKDNLATVEVG